jgi:peptide-methionine (S)-S-oxide reductase
MTRPRTQSARKPPFAGGLPQLLSLALLTAGLSLPFTPSFAQEGIAIPAPVVDQPAVADAATETAVLAGGCFWGVQGVYQHLDGVKNAVSGYAGGDEKSAQYGMVSRGNTGHAEAVEITFDPKKISYGRILQVYFSVAHDPTELNRQGPDVGTQYRSAIFPRDEDQARVAKAYIAELNKARVFDSEIMTKIEPDPTFYTAEAYHQDYLTLNPNQPYIVYNDLPKIENLKRLFPALYRDDPLLVSEAGLSN